MFFFSDASIQWKIVRSADKPIEHRIFAACELLCKPISFLSLLMIPGWAILQRFGVDIPAWITSCLHPILVSAAIGYLTNWIAIEMLFKPYGTYMEASICLDNLRLLASRVGAEEQSSKLPRLSVKRFQGNCSSQKNWRWIYVIW